jgi:hypothetical protein
VPFQTFQGFHRHTVLAGIDVEVREGGDLPGRTVGYFLQHLAAVRQVLRAGIAVRAQRDETEAFVAVRDRSVGCVCTREMHRAGADGVFAQGAGAVVHHLELVHFVEMHAQHAVGRALGQECHRGVDGLVFGTLDEVRAPAEVAVGQVALDAGVFHFVVSFDQWHWILLSGRRDLGDARIVAPHGRERQVRVRNAVIVTHKGTLRRVLKRTGGTQGAKGPRRPSITQQ